MLETKKCNKCSQLLPVEQFYRHPSMADGRLNKCITCAKRDSKEFRAKRIDHYKEIDRIRGRRPETKERVKRYRATPRGQEAARRAHQKQKELRPLRLSARRAINNAIRDGKVIREPCELCGASITEAHHDDYRLPLSVRWLCTKHHKEWHKNHKAKG